MQLMPQRAKQVWIVRHSDTQWSLEGRHTGRSDIPLTPAGARKADALRQALAGVQFGLVLSSPLQRGLETARRCGFEGQVQGDARLLEWDYGQYEGRTTQQIHASRPGWDLWRDGCPGGETMEAVAVRAASVVRTVHEAVGNVLLFSHGHFSRVIAALWLQLPPSRGRSFGLKAGSISVLGYEHEWPVIWQWDRVDSFEGH